MHWMLKCLIAMLALWPGVFRVVESKLVHSLKSTTEVQFLMWACLHFICVFPFYSIFQPSLTPKHVIDLPINWRSGGFS